MRVVWHPLKRARCLVPVLELAPGVVLRDRPDIELNRAEHMLRNGELSVIAQMPWSSNVTLMCDVAFEEQPAAKTANTQKPKNPKTSTQATNSADDHSGSQRQMYGTEMLLQAIFKPATGERPLHDFPAGLYKREIAAYELSKQLGWQLIPPTVQVETEIGPGSLQLMVITDFSDHYFSLRDKKEHLSWLQKLCCFDVIANSTDRKSGHVLKDQKQTLWAIDNALSFHEIDKLRTVIWDFADQAIPAEVLSEVERCLDEGFEHLSQWLSEPELKATAKRCQKLIAKKRFPTDLSGRAWPWPLV